MERARSRVERDGGTCGPARPFRVRFCYVCADALLMHVICFAATFGLGRIACIAFECGAILCGLRSVCEKASDSGWVRAMCDG